MLAGADRGQQRAVADQVRVAADRRGEVAVARRAQPGVPDVLRGVVGLLERAQDQRGQRGAPVAAAVDLLVDEVGDVGDEIGALLGRHRLRQRRRGDVERRQLVDEPLDARGLGPLVHAVERRQPARLEQRRDRLVGRDHQVLDQPVRLRLLAPHELGDVPVARERELGLLRTRRRARPAPRAPPGAPRPPARRRQRLGPRRHGGLVAGEDPVHLRVVQPRARADDRAVERGAARPSPPRTPARR